MVPVGLSLSQKRLSFWALGRWPWDRTPRPREGLWPFAPLARLGEGSSAPLLLLGGSPPQLLAPSSQPSSGPPEEPCRARGRGSGRLLGWGAWPVPRGTFPGRQVGLPGQCPSLSPSFF